MSFLYVELYEVRHEILVRVQDMSNRTDLGLRGYSHIQPDEPGPLQQRTGKFLP